MLFSSTNITTYAMKKDNYVSVSLEMVATQKKTQIKEPSKPEEQPQEVPEAKNVDIGELFSDVWTKDVKIKKQQKKVENKRLELIKKKIKTSKNKSSVKQSSSEEKTNAEVNADKNQKSSSGDEVNEYLAKIQAIVYKHFYPPENSEGHTVKAVIELSPFGKVLDFRILAYSSNSHLNEECNRIKSRLIGVLFPVNPDKKSFTTIVNITSDYK